MRRLLTVPLCLVLGLGLYLLLLAAPSCTKSSAETSIAAEHKSTLAGLGSDPDEVLEQLEISEEADDA